MAKIQHHSVGKHGTIRNGESNLLGKIKYVHSTTFEFRIDGANLSNTFRIDDWDFTPDRPALPTEAGSIILDPVGRNGRNDGIWILNASKKCWERQGSRERFLFPTSIASFTPAKVVPE